ncbi:hypothetical protein PSPO_a1779 [Pseudoalteromonas spongiae UST010723-006]|nr:hypothetical protein PSPO_a1779 [Pseudoalteromonas spongiae UST010723-006]
MYKNINELLVRVALFAQNLKAKVAGFLSLSNKLIAKK